MQARATIVEPFARVAMAVVGANAPRQMCIARGQAIFREDDDAEFFYEILAGTLRCCRLTGDGRRQIFRFAGPASLLGLGCQRRHGYSAEAITDVVARRHRLAGLDAALAGDAVVRGRVLQALRDELAATRTHMLLLGRMSASEKLASFLLALAAELPDGWIDLPMTRSDIADYLGLTIETVSRKLNELRLLGVIRLDTPTRLRITDPERIEALAEAA